MKVILSLLVGMVVVKEVQYHNGLLPVWQVFTIWILAGLYFYIHISMGSNES